MGRAQRRRQENRRRRLEEARAAERKRAKRRTYLMIGLLALVAAAATLFLILSQDQSEEDTAGTPAPSEDTLPAGEASAQSVAEPTIPSSVPLPEGCPATDGSDGPRIDFDGPQPMCIDPDRRYTAVFDTSEGEIRFELTPADTPGTVNNFVTLARWGYYDGTLLFRTDPSIDIIQGGSPHTNSPSDPGPGYNIPGRASLHSGTPIPASRSARTDTSPVNW